MLFFVCVLQPQATRSFDTITVLITAVETYPALQEVLQGTLQAASHYTTLAALAVCSSGLDCTIESTSFTQDNALTYAQACVADVSRSLPLRSRDMYRPMYRSQNSYSNSPLLVNAETAQHYTFCPTDIDNNKQQLSLSQVVFTSTYANTADTFCGQVTAAHKVVLEVPDVMMHCPHSYSAITTKQAAGST
jgi:hypothetical protein